MLELTRELSSALCSSALTEEPLLSLGRGFSAPAIFRTPHGRAERAILMGCDRDAFNRWEAGQILAAEIMLEVAGTARAGADADYLAAIGEVLARAEDDPAFAAQMLMPPTENELATRKTPVDPDGIHGARMALVKAIAAAHRARAGRSSTKHMQAMRGDFQPRREIGGPPRLAQCLSALSHRRRRRSRGRSGGGPLPLRHQHDRHDGRAGGADPDGVSPCADAAFTHFHDRFKSDPLVLDKWMGLQAGIAPARDTRRRCAR